VRDPERARYLEDSLRVFGCVCWYIPLEASAKSGGKMLRFSPKRRKGIFLGVDPNAINRLYLVKDCATGEQAKGVDLFWEEA